MRKTNDCPAQTRRVFPRTSSAWSSLVSSWRMAALCRTTTSRRSRPFTSCSACVVVARSARRRSTPPPRRSSTSTRRPSSPSWSTTRSTVTARLSVSAASAPPPRYVSFVSYDLNLRLIPAPVRCRCLHGCYAQPSVLRQVPPHLRLRRVQVNGPRLTAMSPLSSSGMVITRLVREWLRCHGGCYS